MPVLLVAVVIELAVNRLAVPVLRPPGDRPIPTWHRDLDVIGLYVFHLASVLALAAASLQAWELAVRRDLFLPAARWTIAGVVGVLVALCAWSIFWHAPPSLSFHLESAVTSVMLLAFLGLVLAPQGDRFVKVGLFAAILPFLVHYYGTFALRLLVHGTEAEWSNLPDRIRDWGQQALIVAALVSPVCFAPRPISRSLTRAAPFSIALFVGAIGLAIVKKHFEVGMELASRGLGIDLLPGQPSGLVLYVLAAAAAAWTITATLSAETAARRRIGVGFCLLVVGGYAFVWPLQYLAAVCGILAIAHGGAEVEGEEQGRTDSAPPRFSSPPIPGAAWASWIGQLQAALGTGAPEAMQIGDTEETRLLGARGAARLEIKIARIAGAVRMVEVTIGTPPEAEPPAWTLFARPESALAAGAHPAPPSTPAPVVKLGDEPFDRRFRLQDGAALTAKLVDEAVRDRVTATLDGWVAVWPGTALRYRVFPGRGAPLDHPIPVTELAFRGASTPDRLVALVALLGEIADRALAAPRRP